MYPIPLTHGEDACVGLALMRWAKVAWRTLHGVTFLYPAFDIHSVLDPLQYLLPCSICTEHLHEYLVSHALVLSSPRATFRYIWSLHQAVSVVGSPPYEEILSLYEASYQQDPRAFRETVHDAVWELGWILQATHSHALLLPSLRLYWEAAARITGQEVTIDVGATLPLCYTGAKTTAPASLVWWEKKVVRLARQDYKSESLYFLEDLLGLSAIPYLVETEHVAWVRNRLQERERRYLRGPPRDNTCLYTTAGIVVFFIITGIVLYRVRK